MADDHCSTAADLLVDDDYAGAAGAFSEALEVDPSLVKALTGRSGCFLKLGRHAEALQDANSALQLDGSQEVACFRKGAAAFELEEFETALAAFRKGKTVSAVRNLVTEQ